MTTQRRDVGNALANMVNATIDARLKNVHTCLPGIVDSFDSGKQTASVKITINRVIKLGDEEKEIAYPLVINAPVLFPRAGDFVLTMPVKRGDECLLFFSERSIDNWVRTGKQTAPTDVRFFSLSDAFILPAITSQPRKLDSFNASAAELRTIDGNVRLEVSSSGIEITGDLKVNGDIDSSGEVKANSDGAFTTLSGHIHPTPSGPSSSPTPGT